MPKLNLVSIKCVKRSDDGFQTKDEPYFHIISDDGNEYTVKPGRGRHHIAKGQTLTSFTRDNISFEECITVKLYESDNSKPGIHSKDEFIGKFTPTDSETGKGKKSKTLKDGKDAEYVVKYMIESTIKEDLEDRPEPERPEIERPEFEGPDGSRPNLDGPDITIPRASWATLCVTSLTRQENSTPGPGGLARVRLKANGVTIVSEAALREGDEAIDSELSRRVKSPLTVSLEEKEDGVGNWTEIGTLNVEWTGVPTTRHINRPYTGADGRSYRLACNLKAEESETRAMSSQTSLPNTAALSGHAPEALSQPRHPSVGSSAGTPSGLRTMDAAPRQAAPRQAAPRQAAPKTTHQDQGKGTGQRRKGAGKKGGAKKKR